MDNKQKLNELERMVSLRESFPEEIQEYLRQEGVFLLRLRPIDPNEPEPPKGKVYRWRRHAQIVRGLEIFDIPYQVVEKVKEYMHWALGIMPPGY